MSEIVSMKRASGVLNQHSYTHTTLHGASVRAAHIPNFEAIKRYIEVIDVKYTLLIENEHNEIFEPALIDIGKLVKNCNFPYKNLHHFLMIITEDGKYGKFQWTSTSAHLTKEALFNLLKLLRENTQEFFLEKNLIDASDIHWKSKKVILDKQKLVAMIISRWLNNLAGITPSKMIASIVTSFKQGIHYTRTQENWYNKVGAIVLTPEWIEFLARGINYQVLFLLQQKSAQDKKVA